MTIPHHYSSSIALIHDPATDQNIAGNGEKKLPQVISEQKIPASPPGLWKTGGQQERRLVSLGSGQSGTSIKLQLLELLLSPDLHATPVRVDFATAKNGSVGPAYELHNDHRLLNAAADSMTFGDAKLPFHTWVKQNENWLSTQGLLEKKPAGYAHSNLRRVVYGLYLLARRPDILNQLTQRAMVTWHPDNPAIAIWSEGDKTHVGLKNGEEIAADAVFAAIGGFESKVKDNLDNHPLVKEGHVFHASTYDSQKLKEIPAGSDIFVRGFHLGALDLFEKDGVIDRVTQGGGVVTFASRTGALSPVSAKKSLFEPEVFTMDKLDELLGKGELNAANLKTLIQEEANRQCDKIGLTRFNIDECRNPFQSGKHTSPEKFTKATLEKLEKDIAAAKGGPMTPTILLSNLYNSIYSVAKQMLHDEMVPASEHKACDEITSWPASVPLEIAEKLLALGKNQQARIFAGVESTIGTDDDKKEIVFTSSYRSTDGSNEPSVHTHGTKYIVDATGGYNSPFEDIASSNDPLIRSAVENGIFPPYARKTEDGRIIPLPGIAYNPATQRAEGVGNVAVIGSLTAGRDKLPPSGTAPKLAQDAARAVSTSMITGAYGAPDSRLPPSRLQRDEVFDYSNQLFKKLPDLLASEELRIDGKIETSTLRLLLPDRLPGEAIFTIDESVQFAGFTGISRPEAGKEIGERDQHIVDQMIPKELATPLAYLSEKIKDEKGNEFWVNIVLWKKRVMSPTTPDSNSWQRWTPPPEAEHLKTVRYALFGKPALPLKKELAPFSRVGMQKFLQKGEPPAFKEVHFMNGSVDASRMELNFEEHRLTRTEIVAENGEIVPGDKVVSRWKNPGLPDPAARRWVNVLREQLKNPFR